MIPPSTQHCRWSPLSKISNKTDEGIIERCSVAFLYSWTTCRETSEYMTYHNERRSSMFLESIMELWDPEQIQLYSVHPCFQNVASSLILLTSAMISIGSVGLQLRGQAEFCSHIIRPTRSRNEILGNLKSVRTSRRRWRSIYYSQGLVPDKVLCEFCQHGCFRCNICRVKLLELEVAAEVFRRICAITNMLPLRES